MLGKFKIRVGKALVNIEFVLLHVKEMDKLTEVFSFISSSCGIQTANSMCEQPFSSRSKVKIFWRERSMTIGSDNLEKKLDLVGWKEKLDVKFNDGSRNT